MKAAEEELGQGGRLVVGQGEAAALCPQKSWVSVMSQQGRSLDMSLVIDPQGQNKKARF